MIQAKFEESYICHIDPNYLYVSRKDAPSMIKVDIKAKKVKGIISDENYDQSIYLTKRQIVFGFINDYIYVNQVGEVPLLLDKAEATMVGKFFGKDAKENVYYLSSHRKVLKRIIDPKVQPLNDQQIEKFSSPNGDQIMDFFISDSCELLIILTFNGFLSIFVNGKMASTLNLHLTKSEKAFNVAVCPKCEYIGVSYWDSGEIQPKLKLTKINYRGKPQDFSKKSSKTEEKVPKSMRNSAPIGKFGLLGRKPGKKNSQLLSLLSNSTVNLRGTNLEEEDMEMILSPEDVSLELIDFYKEFSSCSNISGICFACYFSNYPIFVVFQAGSEKRVHYFGICKDRFSYLGSVKGIYSGVVKDVRMVDGDVYAIDSDLNIVKLEIFH